MITISCLSKELTNTTMHLIVPFVHYIDKYYSNEKEKPFWVATDKYR